MSLTPEQEWRRLHRPGRPGKIDCDAEVRAFIVERLETMTFAELAAACRERFGADRAPGKTTINRFWLRQPRPAPANQP